MLTAAFLKSAALVTDAHKLFGGHFWVEAAHIQFEVFLGAWLLANVFPLAAWWAALACFLLYAAYACFQLLTGAESCGCFGNIRTPPWVSLSIDLGAIGLLAIWRRALIDNRGSEFSAARLATPVLAALVSGVALSAGAGWAEGRYSIDIDAVPEGGVAVIRPEAWVGSRCPLLPHIDIGSELAQGRWQLLLYYRDCDKCVRSISAVIDRSPTSSLPHLCLVEVPPYGGRPFPTWHGVRTAKLDGTRKWFVEAPAEIVLSDGIVVSGRSRSEADH